MSATTIKHSRVLSLVLAAALLSLAHGAGDAAKLSQLRRGRRLGSSSGKGKGGGGSTQGTLTNVATFQLDKQQHCAAGYTLSESVKFSPASGKAGKAGKAGSAGTSIKVNSEGGKGKAGKAGSAGTSIEVNSSGGKGKGGKAGSSSRRLSSSSSCGKGKGGGSGVNCVEEKPEKQVNFACGKGKGKGGGGGVDDCFEEKPVKPKFDMITSFDCDSYCACMCDKSIIPSTITVESEVAVKGKAGKAGKAGSAGTSIKVNSEGGKGKAGKAGSAGTSIEVNSSGGKGKGGKAGSSSRRLSSGKGKGGKGGESQVDRVAEINIMVGRVNDSCGKCECNRNEPVEPVVVEVVYPTPPEPTKNPTSSPTELVFASDLPPRACASSHYSFPAGIYDPLGGWLYKITTDSTLSCDDTNIWDLGTDVDGAFDHLVLFRDGIEIMRWGTTCPVDYPVKDGDSLVFYSDNSHEYRGFRVCTDSMEPAAPEEGIIQGNCFVSHPTWDGYGTHYDNYYGYSFKIEKAGTMTSESFNIRGRGTGQALKLYRNNELIGKWNGDEGISNQDVEVGDVISFFVDDSAIYDENTGFKVCFM